MVSFNFPKVNKMISFGTTQSQQNNQFENLYISSHGEARNVWTAGKPHSYGSFEYFTSGTSGVITS